MYFADKSFDLRYSSALTFRNSPSFSCVRFLFKATLQPLAPIPARSTKWGRRIGWAATIFSARPQSTPTFSITYRSKAVAIASPPSPFPALLKRRLGRLLTNWQTQLYAIWVKMIWNQLKTNAAQTKTNQWHGRRLMGGVWKASPKEVEPMSVGRDAS